MKPAIRDVLRLSSESLLDFGLGTIVVLSISPVPRPGRCPVTKRISHGGESGGARIRIAHGFLDLGHITRNIDENGWQEPWNGIVAGNHCKYL
jgi:hypothetical protein